MATVKFIILTHSSSAQLDELKFERVFDASTSLLNQWQTVQVPMDGDGALDILLKVSNGNRGRYFRMYVSVDGRDIVNGGYVENTYDKDGNGTIKGSYLIT